ncbi:MAG TPA: hypothetical protein VGR62_08105 [Candidatus Binatia bacterium]|jgi:hypothetical protein|nr:hypothetical protein [Candidatus Binatia bacterium]
MDPQLIIFAIESAIRLGIKINEVLLDETTNRDLVLPLGDLFGDIDVGNAATYFDDHPELVQAHGRYHGLTSAERVQAYKAMVAINRKLGRADEAIEANQVLERLDAFEQFGKGSGPGHPARRILGTVVEIGIDYFATHPEAMGKDSSAKRIVQAFVLRLDEVDFAEGSPIEIAGDVLTAALHTLDEDVTLLDDDERLHALLHGVTSALITEVAGAASAGDLLARKNLVQRLGSSVLRGAAGAFTENLDLFLPGDGTARTLVESTLTQVMEGVRAHSDLFTNESLELIFRSGLRAVGENAALFSDRKMLQSLITSTTLALTDATGRTLFSAETVAAVVAGALTSASENVDTLIEAKDPQHQRLARAVGAMALGLSTQLGADPSLKDLLSRRQLVDLTQEVFGEVARHPDALLGDHADDPRMSALAQVIGSVAGALGNHPGHLLDGGGLQKLVMVALQVGVRNADGLLDLDHADPTTNLLFRALKEVATAVAGSDDPRRLVDRQGFVDLVTQVLPVVSANLDPLLATQDPLVQRTVARALQLANGAVRGRVDGRNLPLLVRGLLVEVLWDELDLTNDIQIETAAKRILRAVA